MADYSILTTHSANISETTELNSAKRQRNFLQRQLGFWFPHFVIIASQLIVLGPLATGQKAPGFRDSAFLYYPLFKWIDKQQEAGEIPFWNPYDNFGSPVVEDCSSSIFYPGKIVFRVQALPYPARFGTYLLIHGLLAAYGAFWCARVFRANRLGAALAAVSYALSGAVLFQICNVIFFVSAAWLPWSLGLWWLLFDKQKAQAKLPYAVLCGMTIAMMILGGDPQMAYHSALLGFTMLLFFAWQQRKLPDANRTSFWNCIFVNSATYAAVGIVAFCLCAIQLLPTASYAKYSERGRAEAQRPRCLLEASEYLFEDVGDNNRWSEIGLGILGQPEPETHHADAYEFSQPPWSAAQLIWPNNTGRFMPEFRRWTFAFPDVQKIWTPSIYLGIIPLMFAICAFRFHGNNKINVWLTWTTVVFGLGSLGTFGLAWLVKYAAFKLTGNEILESTGDGVGGIYWLMVTLLPKYIVFRYPAKLFVIATLGFSLLAARLTNQKRICRSKLLPVLLGFCLASSVVALLFVTFNQSFLAGISRIGPHETLGPFNVQGCLRDIQAGLLSTIAVVSFLVAAVWALRKKKISARSWMTSILLVTAIELLLANGWLALTVDSEYFEKPIDEVAAYRLATDSNKQISGAPLRILRFPRQSYYPPAWAEKSSSDRLGEIVLWQRRTLHPKFQLDDDIQLIGSFSTIEISPENIGYEHDEVIDERWLIPGGLNRQKIEQLGIGGIILPPNELATNFEIPKSYYEVVQTIDGVKILSFRNSQNKSLQYPLDRIAEFEPANNRIRFGIHMPADGTTLKIPIAWSPGWSATLKQATHEPPGETEVLSSKIELKPYSRSQTIAEIKIPQPDELAANAGTWIELEYQPVGLKSGLQISRFAWIVFLIWLAIFVAGQIWKFRMSQIEKLTSPSSNFSPP